MQAQRQSSSSVLTSVSLYRLYAYLVHISLKLSPKVYPRPTIIICWLGGDQHIIFQWFCNSMKWDGVKSRHDCTNNSLEGLCIALYRATGSISTWPASMQVKAACIQPVDWTCFSQKHIASTRLCHPSIKLLTMTWFATVNSVYLLITYWPRPTEGHPRLVCYQSLSLDACQQNPYLLGAQLVQALMLKSYKHSAALCLVHVHRQVRYKSMSQPNHTHIFADSTCACCDSRYIYVYTVTKTNCLTLACTMHSTGAQNNVKGAGKCYLWPSFIAQTDINNWTCR